VRSNGKLLRLSASAALLLLAGCSGINASKSVSPLDFLLPGLTRTDLPPGQPDRVQPAVAPAEPVALN
jgi:hypothetical protein